ncbi:MAG: LacI family DNA-binding transcriptional regulator [Victivallaceae bacterium]|nr:LacI family DNA-binding transcriptional regulator [Victivallaceae bacterium]
MASKKLTIKEFAELLGVSTATVSRAFSSKGRISEKTRRHIIAKAGELNYCANIHARSLSSPDSSLIALYYPELNSEEPDYFVAEIMMGINSTLAKHGKNLQVNPLPLAAPEAILKLCKEQILSGAVAGVIIMYGSKNSQELYKCARDRAVPCVVIGRMEGVKYNNVIYDMRHGAFLAGRYFKNTGRKHPAYLRGHLDRNKQKGFQMGLEMPAAQIVKIGPGFGFRDGYHAMELIAEKHSETDCVLCATDSMAMGFIKAALDRKVRIPRDIAVISYDDTCAARYYAPALSSVRLKPFEIGRSAAMILERVMNGEKNIQAEIIECDLVVRESS